MRLLLPEDASTMLLNIHVDPTSPTKCQNRFSRNWLFDKIPKHNEKVFRSRDVFDERNWTKRWRKKNILFIARSLCCLGHPQRRMFKFQLNHSRFYMHHEHHIYPKMMLNPSVADCWLIRRIQRKSFYFFFFLFYFLLFIILLRIYFQ